MKFDKSKVYTAVNADELKIGSKVLFADSLRDLKQSVLENAEPATLSNIQDEFSQCRFVIGNESPICFTLAYLVSEPEEKKLKWTDLKIGDVITSGKLKFMVTAIDSEDNECHIFAGDVWFTDKELEEWEKVNE